MSNPIINDYVCGLKYLIDCQRNNKLADEQELELINYLDDLYYKMRKEDRDRVYDLIYL